MTPLRLFILAVLLYIGWRLLRRRSRRKIDDVVRPEQDNESQDILVEDPVCHTLIPKKQAVRLRTDGKTYYFCSENCCDLFTGEPRGGK